MSVEFTLSIIKPDAVSARVTGEINAMIEASGLTIVGQKRIVMTPEMAAKFYEVHSERPFYRDLVRYMSGGPVVVQVLMGESAISKYRKLMGDTDPSKAEEATIRKKFGKGIEANAVHGSDSNQTANVEIPFFFATYEIMI